MKDMEARAAIEALEKRFEDFKKWTVDALNTYDDLRHKHCTKISAQLGALLCHLNLVVVEESARPTEWTVRKRAKNE